MRKRNSKQKELSTDQKIKYYGIFFLVVGLAYSFEVFFQTLLVNVICLTFLCVLVFMGMELYTRERVEFGGKLGVFKPIFNGFVYTMGFIFKSMYFHLRTRIIFAYNIIVLILPMIGLFYNRQRFYIDYFFKCCFFLYNTLVLGSFWIRSSV